ncbi:Arc family DNA-binding protein [Collimonas humicola]|uniref:Arc family DNA-binding protein n=1 Tax=Collimonas humicola TaxID=2825886 RepID=UPI001B8C428B|nr:Arc family DNA-binding protein [Collimonas humicola]
MKKYEPVRPKTTNIVPFGLRMQPDLRGMIEAAMEESGRSMNAEICVRLQQSFGPDKTDEILAATQKILEIVSSSK